MKKKLIYQTKEYVYPKNAWFFACWYEVHQDSYIPVYSTSIKDSQLGTTKYAREFIQEVRENSNSTNDILDEVLLVKLELNDLYPLKKAYWNNPVHEINEVDRIEVFSKAIKFKGIHQVIVTPSYKTLDTKEIVLSNAFAVKKGHSEEIDLFMRYSNHPVFRDAKRVGIYDIGNIVSFDLLENKVVDVENSYF